VNRPAILMLSDGSGRSQQVVLTRIGENDVGLRAGDHVFTATIAELSRYWFGDYLLLWHPVVPAVSDLRPGTHGPAVRQLGLQLLRWSGATGIPLGASYDTALTQLVEEFQRAHHLNVDGIAGIETQLVLDAAVAAPDTPLLSLPAQRGS